MKITEKGFDNARDYLASLGLMKVNDVCTPKESYQMTEFGVWLCKQGLETLYINNETERENLRKQFEREGIK